MSFTSCPQWTFVVLCHWRVWCTDSLLRRYTLHRRLWAIFRRRCGAKYDISIGFLLHLKQLLIPVITTAVVAAMRRIASLPDETLVYCGHEYTLQNLRFLHTIDPKNPKISEKLAWTKHQINQGVPTVPSTIGAEKEYNLFMQTDDPRLQTLLGTKDATTTMQLLRDKKNNF